jgi:hypothetical protein
MIDTHIIYYIHEMTAGQLHICMAFAQTRNWKGNTTATM